jgi:hypothetical protein
VKIPTFSRRSDTTLDDERPTVAAGGTAVRPRTDNPRPSCGAAVAGPSDATTTRWSAPAADGHAAADRDANVDMAELQAERARADADRTTAGTDRTETGRQAPGTGTGDRPGTAAGRGPERTPVPAGPKPRASLLATLSLILGVASALLVLSGPLLGYGIGVAVLGLILSLAGIRATRRRHVAGKTDALIGMVLSLAAIVVGVLALTGSLSWAGTDLQPATNTRDWLDARFMHRF